MVKIQCTGCGKTWEYTRDKPVTSCPNCGNRVKTGYAKRTYGQVPSDVTSRTAEQTRYY